jgi:hypothetical protein
LSSQTQNDSSFIHSLIEWLILALSPWMINLAIFDDFGCQHPQVHNWRRVIAVATSKSSAGKLHLNSHRILSQPSSLRSSPVSSFPVGVEIKRRTQSPSPPSVHFALEFEAESTRTSLTSSFWITTNHGVGDSENRFEIDSKGQFQRIATIHPNHPMFRSTMTERRIGVWAWSWSWWIQS